MKQILRVSVEVSFLIAMASIVPISKDGTLLPVAYAQASCNNTALTGVYAFAFSGWATPPPKALTEGKSSIPVAAVGIATFDGAGNWITNLTFSHDGDISSATAVPGTYTVNSDCTGSLIGIADFAVVIANGGAEITGVETDNDTTSTSTIHMRRQNATACTDASLTGKYSLALIGFGTPPTKLVPANSSVPVALAGLVTFGAGNFTGSFTRSHNGDITTASSDVGAYTVNSDCTGTISDRTAGTNFAIVLLSGGRDVFGVETDNGTASTFEAKKQ